MAFYHVMFDRAVEEAFMLLDLGADYLAERGGTTFAAECHVHYRQEVKPEMPMRITIQLVDYDEKRVHLYMEMRHANEGWLAATSENLYLHVDVASRKVIPFPADILENIATMKQAHSSLPRPDALGRMMGIPKKAHGRMEVH
jgi:acyl-CoA thioester hydrolase